MSSASPCQTSTNHTCTAVSYRPSYTRSLGYLTVYAGWHLTQRSLVPGTVSLRAGRLGNVKVNGSDVILGEPLKFTKNNIDAFHF
jgi:hypothetical protein